MKVSGIISDKTLNDIEKYKKIALALFEKYQLRESIEDWQINWMKELREQGFSYEDIGKISNTGITTVRFHLIDGERDKMRNANIKHRIKMKQDPVAWRKYLDYQSEYQKQFKIKRREMVQELETLKEKAKIPEVPMEKSIEVNTQNLNNKGENENENENKDKIGSLENS
jgi:hypothetical protein